MMMDIQLVNRNVRVVDKRDSLTRIAGWLRGESKDIPVIMDGKRPYAVVDARKLSSRGIRASTRIEKAALPVPVLDPETSEDEALNHISSTLAPYLPVVDEHGKVIGTLSAADALLGLKKTPKLAAALEDVPQLSPADTLAAATKAFAKTHANWLPVVHQGHVAGVLARSTLMRMQAITDQPDGQFDWGGENADIRNEPVSGYMDQGWVECTANEEWGRARSRLQKNGYAFLVDGDRFKGLVTANSLARAALPPSASIKRRR